MEKLKRNKSILFLFLLIITVISISIGYCNISDIILNIEGTAETDIGGTVYIDSVELADGTTAGGSYGTYEKEGTLLQLTSLTLPKENVTSDTNTTILVNVKNSSNLSYEFTGISYLTTEDLTDSISFSVINSNPNIQIDESSYQDLLNTLIDGSSNGLPGKLTVPIRFKYVDIENITDNTLNISIKLNFKKIEKQVYKLETGKKLYGVIGSKHSEATKILFCAKPDVPTGATELGEVGLNAGEIKAYYYDTTLYIAALTRYSTIQFNDDSGYMFSNGKVDDAFYNVTSIKTSTSVGIDTSNVTQFQEMFKGCKKLTDGGIQQFINDFDTSSATNMCAMFGSTESLTSLNLSAFNTKNVTDMSWMFEDNYKLKNINFGQNFDTSSVKGNLENQGMAGMFRYCTSLKYLNLSTFNTSQVASMWRMFEYCNNLERIYVSDNFVTTGLSATKIPNSVVDVFKYCNKLVGENGTTFTASKVTDVSYAHIDGGISNPGYFSKNRNHTVTLNANGGKFGDNQSVKQYTGTNMIEVTFNEIPTYENKYLAGWAETPDAKKAKYYIGDTHTFLKSVTLYAVWEDAAIYILNEGPNVYSTISSCRSETEHLRFTTIAKIPANSTLLGSVDKDEGGNVKAYYNEGTKTLYFATETEKSIIAFNKNSSHMFSNGKTKEDAFYKLQTIDFDSGFDIDTGAVQSFAEIFKYNVALTQDSIQAFINRLDTSSVTNMCAMFEHLSISTIDVSNFDTTNVTDMSWMFHGGSYTNIIFGDNFDTSNVNDYSGMFHELKQMEKLDISIFKAKSGVDIKYMFGLCPKLQTIYVSEDNGFDKARTGIRTFERDTALIGGTGENQTAFSIDADSSKYAIVSTKDTPGYFTNIADKNTVN